MMAFLNPIYLWSLWSLLLPLAIHLWNQKERKVILVGSIKWFSHVPPRRAKRLKLSDKRLLLLRMLMLLLISLMMAGLYVEKKGVQNKKTLLLIDKQLIKDEASFFEPLIADTANHNISILEQPPSWENYLRAYVPEKEVDSVNIYCYKQDENLSFSGFKLPFYTEFHLFEKERSATHIAFQRGDSLYIHQDNQFQAFHTAQLPKGISINKDSLFIDEQFVKLLPQLPTINIDSDEVHPVEKALWKAIRKMEYFNEQEQADSNDAKAIQLYSGENREPSGEYDIAFLWNSESAFLLEKEYVGNTLFAHINPYLWMENNELPNLVEFVWQLIFEQYFSQSMVENTNWPENFTWPSDELEHQTEIVKIIPLWPIIIVLLFLLAIVERWWAHRIMKGKIRG